MELNSSDIVKRVVLMVMPIRREFNRGIDLTQFFHDFAYANEIIELALTSKNANLLEHANYVREKLHGPRNNIPVAEQKPPPFSPTVPSMASIPEKVVPALPDPSPVAPKDEQSEHEALKTKMLNKYTGGLR